MSKIRFHHLYVQTEYNFLSSTISMKKLKEKLYRFEDCGIAIMDNGMFGAYKFYKVCSENDKVKPIIGYRCRIYNKNIENVVLLYAKNEIGYKNILKISTENLSNPQNVNYEFLKQHQEGIIAIIPFLENEIRYYYNNQAGNHLINTLAIYKNTFDNLYIGLTKQVSDYSFESLVHFFKNQDFNLVAIHKLNRIENEEIEAYEVLRLVKTKADSIQISELEQNGYLMVNDELVEMYQAYPELLENQEKIVNSCNVQLGFHGYLQPKLTINKEETGYANAKEMLEDLCKKGINHRIEENRKIFNKNYGGLIGTYRDRLLMELDVINRMGFNDYFLIVADYVRFAKENSILVGCGRGSAGGSLVCYALGITDVDPIEYGLLFERFLNEDRISMPDIDVDFQGNKRDEVCKYIANKYGESRFASIVTYSTFQPKSAIDAVGKALKISEPVLKSVKKEIEDGIKEISKRNNQNQDNLNQDNLVQEIINKDITLKNIYNIKPMLQRMVESDESVQKLIKVAMEIEGIPANTSTHACGYIMAPTDLVEYTALYPNASGIMQTQYDEYDLEKLGLVKMDILSVNDLNIIDDTVRNVKKINKDFDLNHISLNDSRTFELLRRGNTTGVFQLENVNVRALLAKMKTNSIEDISCVTALYRPATNDSGTLNSFINRKNGKEQIDYIDPCLVNILKPTYGIILYQEQMMLIAREYAGFTLKEADVLRKAASKKKMSEMEQQRNKFFEKSLALGRDKKTTEKVFNYIAKFADYGFNKSHAVAYSIIAYQMAYLKANYPEMFLCAYLNNTSDLMGSLEECRSLGVKIFPPMINKSGFDYIPGVKAILCPFTIIKNVDKKIVTEIINERDNGPFTSYSDFIKRMRRIVDKKWVCNMIYAGCFDEFKKEESKKSMVDNFDSDLMASQFAHENSGLKLKNREKGKEEFSFSEISLLEKEALGFNLTYNMLIVYQPIKQKWHSIDLAALKPGVKSFVLGFINDFRENKTKKGEDMAFFKITDTSMSMDGLIFPRDYALLQERPKEGDVAVVKGYLQIQDYEGVQKKTFICEAIYIQNR